MITHLLSSSFQSGPREIRVLLPDAGAPTRRYPVLYVLPVEPEGEHVYGDGLSVLQELDVTNRYGCILVQMEFSHTPWYADHATQPDVRPASHLEKVVVPFVEERYATIKGKNGRFLTGFSKSGWGAFSLILRNPDFWGYAAAWDAPWLMSTFHWDVSEAFGTVAQFDAHRPDRLVERHCEPFRKKNRLVLGGERSWGPVRDGSAGLSHTQGFHELLKQRGIQHVYRADLCVEHTWNRHWVGPMVEELMKLTLLETDRKTADRTDLEHHLCGEA